MISKPYLWYAAYHAFRCGSVRRQLMHEYVQKSTRTTLPRRPAIESGFELNHWPPAMIGGAFAITGRPLAPGPAEAVAGVVVVVGSSSSFRLPPWIFVRSFVAVLLFLSACSAEV